jgi:hypothetical protein
MQDAIIEANGVAPLLHLVKVGTPLAQEHAARTLWHLTEVRRPRLTPCPHSPHAIRGLFSLTTAARRCSAGRRQPEDPRLRRLHHRPRHTPKARLRAGAGGCPRLTLRPAPHGDQCPVPTDGTWHCVWRRRRLPPPSRTSHAARSSRVSPSCSRRALPRRGAAASHYPLRTPTALPRAARASPRSRPLVHSPRAHHCSAHHAATSLRPLLLSHRSTTSLASLQHLYRPLVHLSHTASALLSTSRTCFTSRLHLSCAPLVCTSRPQVSSPELLAAAAAATAAVAELPEDAAGVLGEGADGEPDRLQVIAEADGIIPLVKLAERGSSAGTEPGLTHTHTCTHQTVHGLHGAAPRTR